MTKLQRDLMNIEAHWKHGLTWRLKWTCGWIS